MSVSIFYKPVLKNNEILGGGSFLKTSLEQFFFRKMPMQLDSRSTSSLENARAFASAENAKDLNALIDAIEKYGIIEVYAEY